jgi:hypothetical protein
LTLSWRGVGVLEQTESLIAPNGQPAPSQANRKRSALPTGSGFTE